MTDFLIILQRHTAVTQHGMVTGKVKGIFVQATVCSKKDQFKLQSECFFKDICIKLYFLK